MSPESVPTEIQQAGPDTLRIAWSDGHESLYPVVYLRRTCGCAGCVDEWTGRRLLEPEHVSQDVKPVQVEPVGRYGIRFEWSDGHDSGIYSFDRLREICPCAACKNQAAGPRIPPRED